MVYPDFQAGQRLTADLLRALAIDSVSNGDDQTVTSSTALIDSNLSVTVEATAIYKYRLMASYTASTGGDIQFAWSVPTGGTMQRWTWGIGPGSTGGAGDAETISMRRPDAGTAVSAGGGTTTRGYHEEGTFIGGSVDGDFTLRFAQDTSNATGTVLTSSSRVEFQRIG